MPPTPLRSSSAAYSLPEQIRRVPRRRVEEEGARVLELLAQPGLVDLEELTFPFAHLAGDAHGLDIAALHHLHDSTRYVVDREHVDVRGVEDDDVGFLAGRERAGLTVQSKMFRAVDSGVAQHVPHVEQRQRAWRWRGGRRWPRRTRSDAADECCEVSRVEYVLVHHHALHGHGGAHLGEEVRRQVRLDVDAERRLDAQFLHFVDGRNAMAHVHLDRERDRDVRADLLDPLPALVRHAGHVDEQMLVLLSEPQLPVVAGSAVGELVEGRAYAERREDMRRKLELLLTPDVPGELVVGQVDLDAHDHVDELIAGRKPLIVDAGRVSWILGGGDIVGNAEGGAGTLEVAEGGAASGIE